MPRLGILVVGQSPRPEVESEFARLLAGVDLDQRGCLDGLSRAEIADLAPAANETALFTRLPSGEGVTLSKQAVIRHGVTQLDALATSGADAVVVLCTGDFPDWADRRVLFPSAVLRHFVLGLLPAGRLGVLTPLAAQADEAERRWAALGYAVTQAALSPNAGMDEIEQAGAELAAGDPDLLVLDCVSYTRKTKRILCAKTGRPAILAISAVARAAAELLDRG